MADKRRGKEVREEEAVAWVANCTGMYLFPKKERSECVSVCVCVCVCVLEDFVAANNHCTTLASCSLQPCHSGLSHGP